MIKKYKYKRHSAKLPHTLCWDCENCCGKCSWSATFTPIPGWTATENTLRSRDKTKTTLIKTYCVHSCPLFVRDSLCAGRVRINTTQQQKGDTTNAT